MAFVDRQPAYLSVSIIGCSLALLTTLMRIYVRAFVVCNVSVDDYVMIVAMATTVAEMSLNIMQTINGMGRHYSGISGNQLQMIKALYYTELSQLLFLLSTLLAKVSLCQFLLRLVNKDKVGWHALFLYGIMAVTFALNMSELVVLAIKAEILKPGSFASKVTDAAIWEPFLSDTCFPASVASIPLAYVQGVWAVLSDLLLAAFPVAILKELKMSRRTKTSLAAVMGLGVFTAAASLARTMSLTVLDQSGDLSYVYITLAAWAIVEQDVAIIAINAPCIRPLFINRPGSTRWQTTGAASRMTPQSLTGSNLTKFTARSGKGGAAVTVQSSPKPAGNPEWYHEFTTMPLVSSAGQKTDGMVEL